MSRVRILCGPKRSDRAQIVEDLFVERANRALFVLPTGHAVQQTVHSLLERGRLPGLWRQPVVTFQGLVERVLKHTSVSTEVVGDHERRLLVESAVHFVFKTPKKHALAERPMTIGFVNHVVRVVTQLKQAAVEPAEFREIVKRRGQPHPYDTFVADVYEHYQAALKTAAAYDLVGLYWEARIAVETQKPAGLQDVDTLIVDGFDDFTSSESRLLQALTRHMDLTVFAMHCDLESAGAVDLYAVPRKTVAALQRQYDVQPETLAERPATRYSEFASSYLFFRDEIRDAPELISNLVLKAYPTVLDEIEETGRDVKQLLLDDWAAPGEIAVVLPNLRDTAPMLTAVFREFGLPLHIHEPRRLEDSGVARTLLIFLDATRTWRRETVCDLLASPFFRPPNLDTTKFSDVIRHITVVAQIMAEYDEWTDRLDALRERCESDNVNSSQITTDSVDAVHRAVDLCRELRRKLDETHSASQAFAVLLEIVEELGLAGGAQHVDDSNGNDAECNALETLRQNLVRAQRWSHKVGGAPSMDIARHLRSLFQESTIPASASDNAVRALTPEALRHLSFKYVYFLSVNEGQIPRPPAVNAVYGDADIEFFREQGVRLESKTDRADRELILFHHVLNVPSERIRISWHVRSIDGRDAAESPFIEDVRRALATYAFEEHVDPSAAAPMPSRIASLRDVSKCAHSGSPMIARLFPEELRPSIRGARVEAERQSTGPFGRYDGVLASERARKAVMQRFGPDSVFSVSRIEAYASCPFRFFTEYVVGVRESEAPTTEFDPGLRGRILHAALQRFHERFRGLTPAEIPENEGLNALAEVVDEVFGRHAWRDLAAPRPVREVERATLLKRLERYFRLEREKDSPWRPQHVEVSFGDVKEMSGDALNRPEPFLLDTERGPVLLAGKIDRIDLQGGDARIVDYKTTSVVQDEEVEAGVSLQLGLYALALERHLNGGWKCQNAEVLVPGNVKKGRYAYLGEKRDNESRKAQVAQYIGQYVARIREAAFPPTPFTEEHCFVCKFRKACRYDENRIERKEAAE